MEGRRNGRSSKWKVAVMRSRRNGKVAVMRSRRNGKS